MKEARYKQSQKIHLYEMSRIARFLEAESRLVVARGWDGEEEGEQVLKGVGFFLR